MPQDAPGLLPRRASHSAVEKAGDAGAGAAVMLAKRRRHRLSDNCSTRRPSAARTASKVSTPALVAKPRTTISAWQVIARLVTSPCNRSISFRRDRGGLSGVAKESRNGCQVENPECIRVLSLFKSYVTNDDDFDDRGCACRILSA